MSKLVHWHIGSERSPLDRPPFRAYFFVVQDGLLCEATDFDVVELTKEIARRRSVGEAVEPYDEALDRLTRLQRK